MVLLARSKALLPGQNDMRGHREVLLRLSGQLPTRFQSSHKSFRITSLADPHHLTPVESNRYTKQGGTPHRRPRPPTRVS